MGAPRDPAMASVPTRPPAPGLQPGGTPLRVGLLSDTHGLLRPESIARLQGCDWIIHAGDICDPAILDALRALAPVTAVRGNCDQGPWAGRLRETERVRMGSISVYVIHNLARLEIDPEALGIRVVVSGHSHQPSVETRGGVLYVNPGSCGPRRFKLPVAMGELVIAGDRVRAGTVQLAISCPWDSPA